MIFKCAYVFGLPLNLHNKIRRCISIYHVNTRCRSIILSMNMTCLLLTVISIPFCLDFEDECYFSTYVLDYDDNRHQRSYLLFHALF